MYSYVFHIVKFRMCSGPCPRRARDGMDRFRRSSFGRIPAKKNKLSIGVGQKHSIRMGKATLIVLLISRVWALRHQTGKQYSAAECTRTKVQSSESNVVAPAPRFDSINCFKSPTRVVNFFRSNSRYQRNVGVLFDFMPSYIGSAQ